MPTWAICQSICKKLPTFSFSIHINEHRVNEYYVREARRITGRSVFTRHDAVLALGLERAPVYADSLGVTEGSVGTRKTRAYSDSVEFSKKRAVFRQPSGEGYFSAEPYNSSLDTQDNLGVQSWSDRPFSLVATRITGKPLGIKRMRPTENIWTATHALLSVRELALRSGRSATPE